MVFASEDDELTVALQIEHGGKTFWMGETVPLGAEEAEVTVVLHISQAEGSDDDSQTEGPYVATLFSDSDGVGGSRATKFDSFEIPEGQTVTRFVVPVVAGEYFYFEVSEIGGKDNPTGDGDDDTGPDGTGEPDGFRDDLNDQAWTSPVWFSGDAVN